MVSAGRSYLQPHTPCFGESPPPDTDSLAAQELSRIEYVHVFGVCAFREQLQSLVLDGVAFAARRRSFDRLSHVDSRSTSRGRQHMKRDAAKSAEHSSVRHQSSRAKRSRRVQDKLETQLGSSNRIEKKRHPNLTSSDDGESRLHASNGPKSGSAEVLQGLPATARRPDQGRWVHVSS